MKDPAAVAETHAAWVVLLGDRAYKVKTPVDLGFLDYSSREAREQAAHREVELNRRLSPDVYLGVADVMGPDGMVQDHIVVMRRMPGERRLSTLVRHGVPLSAEIRAIARLVASFHAGAARSPRIDEAGSPSTITAKVARDLEELQALAGGVLDPDDLADVARLIHRYLDGRAPLYEARVTDGRIVDGHGDLLADDIFCLPDGPRILDCIEFDDRLRHGDVLADVAFLAMDLERLGARRLATDFVAAYCEFTNEHHPTTLINYYIAFRALIRSKVACIRAEQGDVDAADSARALLALALAHAGETRMPMVLVGGAPGTGKSTLAAALSNRLGWVVLRSDEVRKDITGVGRATEAPARFGEGIYDPATTDAAYTALLARARHALEFGEPVILDASWAQRRWREVAAQVARDAGGELVLLRCEVPAEVAERRIDSRRATHNDPSDATTDVASVIRKSFDPWPDAVTVHTDVPLNRSVIAALDAVGEPRVQVRDHSTLRR